MKRVSAGLIDSGMASIATFLIGLYAIRIWVDDTASIGVFALFMAAFSLSTAITTQLAFIPAEKLTLALKGGQRSRLAKLTLPRGSAIAVIGALVIAFPMIVASLQGTPSEVVLAFGLTTYVTSVLSPLQDHLRRLMHLAGESWRAASVSVVQVVTSAAGVLVVAAVAGEKAWVPFGALALANLVSFSVAWVLNRGVATRSPEVDAALSDEVVTGMGFRNLFASGKWLVSTGVFSTGNNFLVAAIVSTLAGQDALGFAEAARQLAQPVLVVALGLRASLGPQSMEAGKLRDMASARKVSRVFIVLTAAVASVWLVVAGIPWAASPLPSFVAAAYVFAWLIPLTIAGNVFNGISQPYRMELIGADAEYSLFTSEAKANASQLILATTIAAVAGSSTGIAASARPAGFAALGIARLIFFRSPLRRHYAGEAPVKSSAAAVSKADV